MLNGLASVLQGQRVRLSDIIISAVRVDLLQFEYTLEYLSDTRLIPEVANNHRVAQNTRTSSTSLQFEVYTVQQRYEKSSQSNALKIVVKRRCNLQAL